MIGPVRTAAKVAGTGWVPVLAARMMDYQQNFDVSCPYLGRPLILLSYGNLLA